MYIAATTREDATLKQLIWDTDGYVRAGEYTWEDTTVIAKLIYHSGKVGIIPRMMSNTLYIECVMENEQKMKEDGSSVTEAKLTINHVFDTRTITIAEVKGLAALVANTTYTLKTVMKGTNLEFFLGAASIANVEISGFRQGAPAVLATTGNACSEIEVQSDFPDGWTTNAATVKNSSVFLERTEGEDAYMELRNPLALSELSLSQDLVIEPGAHTISFDCFGDVQLRIRELNGALPQVIELVVPSSAEWERPELSFETSADCTSIRTEFYLLTSTVSGIDNVQVEASAYATDYIPNDSLVEAAERTDSFITYPAKNNIVKEEGTIAIWVSPWLALLATTTESPVFVEYGDYGNGIVLSYSNGNIVFRHGANTVSKPLPEGLPNFTWVHLVCSWNGYSMSLYVNEVKTERMVITGTPSTSNVIRFGHSSSAGHVFNGILDSASVYNRKVSDEEVKLMFHSAEPYIGRGAILDVTFDNAIGSYDTSYIESTPIPQYGSPIIAQKEDGTPLRKVSFLDPDTGDYRPYNQEFHVYDGKSDYLTLAQTAVDTEHFAIVVEDEDGITYGDPVRVEGRRLYLTLQPTEKIGLTGKELRVTYQVKDSYVVDFNTGMPDVFKVQLGQHDGKPVEVTHEGNRFSSEKLVTMVDLNPLQNANHQGFLYITNNVEKISNYRVKATPSEVPADHFSESLIVIEPKDIYGNFISHADLEVRADRGMILSILDPGSVEARETAGRYLYRYIPPMIRASDVHVLELEDLIHVIDKDTGIGAQVPITLIIEEEYSRPRQAVDHFNAELEQEMIAVRVLDAVMRHMNQLTTEMAPEMANLLDFDRDGRITIREIGRIREMRGTDWLEDIYRQLVVLENS